MTLKRLALFAALAAGLGYIALADTQIGGPFPVSIQTQTNGVNAINTGTLNFIATGGLSRSITNTAGRADLILDGSALVGTNHTGTVRVNGSLTVSNGLTVGDSITGNGTANILPNQTAASGSSIMTRDLTDARLPYGTGKRIPISLGDALVSGATVTADPWFMNQGVVYACPEAAGQRATRWNALLPTTYSPTGMSVVVAVTTSNIVTYRSQAQSSVLSATGVRTLTQSVLSTNTTAAGTNTVVLTNTVYFTPGIVNHITFAIDSVTNGTVWFNPLYMEWQ